MANVMRQIPVMTRLKLSLRIAASHPSWSRYHPKSNDATAAVTLATSTVIAVTRSSRTLTSRFHGRGPIPSRKSKRRCRRRVLLMSTQSYLIMEGPQIMTDAREKKTGRTKTANVAPADSIDRDKKRDRMCMR